MKCGPRFVPVLFSRTRFASSSDRYSSSVGCLKSSLVSDGAKTAGTDDFLMLLVTGSTLV